MVSTILSPGLVIQFVTNRHKQIAKLFCEKLPETKHYYDVWHVAKSELHDDHNIILLLCTDI